MFAGFGWKFIPNFAMIIYRRKLSAEIAFHKIDPWPLDVTVVTFSSLTKPFGGGRDALAAVASATSSKLPAGT
jgi:hypothetical protein